MQSPGYPAWTGNEPCRSTDPDIFYPETDLTLSLAATIRKICGGCPSQSPCASWGIWHERQGWWGGLSPADRDVIRRQRNIIVTTPDWR